MVHANARLTLHGRKELIARVQAGRPVAHVAAEMGISRATAYKWWRRWRHEGDAASPIGRAGRTVHRRRRHDERNVRIEQLRRSKKLGPAALAGSWGCTPRRCIACSCVKG